ncbi:lactate permease [Sulfobacillus thermosulfidooxidans DSM 9293]|uniref:L-lactate permease n=1 Tax=Sulfobacillus thermosulfidooxidans (strain DSM 9293 / VKM B-1269 / AT-1) TaxID=929705 RepID=A0A1W1WCW8_SULTA|nr:L-lactate permease [Sulfobacillus thermosulfidooxidans]SMC04127.1 lactate permease [Sulfobacillus thermosulfidooxidans DSM 9293]
MVFHQILNPAHHVALTAILALIPFAVLLALLAGFRITAWLSVIVGSIVTLAMAIGVWKMPLGTGLHAYFLGSLTGFWDIDWITLWGVVIFNTLTLTGIFDTFKTWLISQATADIRVQTILLAWSLGALLEGLVGFGYPWAVMAPILIGFGIVELDAIRVAAIANNAPVSYGALGVPIIALAAVTGLPLLSLSASVGKIVALLALLPPWLLIYLVTGKKGLRDGWPLAVVGSLSYILGQFPVSQWVGPYLPDVTGSLVSFGALLLFLRVWRPRHILGYGGVELDEVAAAGPDLPRLSAKEVWRAWMPFIVLIVVVVLWTGPWSPLPKISWLLLKVTGISSISHKVMDVEFSFTPFVGGTSILASWLVILLFVRPQAAILKQIFQKTLYQMWGAIVVGIFIFGLADVFNFSGMAASLAYAFSRIGPAFILLAPILGWIGVALSGSNTSTNAMFGVMQTLVGKLLGFPILLLPSLNSVGAEVGKPIAPQTASVGVSTSQYVRSEGAVIRHNLGWTLVVLAWLIVVGLLYYFLAPGLMRL